MYISILFSGIPVHQLDIKSLRCGLFPNWGIITISSASGVLLFLLVVSIIKYRQRVKQRLVHHDSLENLADMKHDAFISYR